MSRSGAKARTSLLLSAACRWARTLPCWSIEAISATVGRSRVREPRTVLPSTAITLRFAGWVREWRKTPTAWSKASPSRRLSSRRTVPGFGAGIRRVRRSAGKPSARRTHGGASVIRSPMAARDLSLRSGRRRRPRTAGPPADSGAHGGHAGPGRSGGTWTDPLPQAAVRSVPPGPATPARRAWGKIWVQARSRSILMRLRHSHDHWHRACTHLQGNQPP